MERLPSIREASELLNLKTPTIYKWVSQKTIQFVKLGERLLFRRESLEAWVKRHSFKDQTS